MNFPTEIFDLSKITSRYGNRSNPFTGASQFHNGIDYAVANDTPLYAPAAGVVRDNWYDNSGGNQMRIKHDNGITTGYAHLSAIRKTKGQRVKAGELFALSGSTGNVTGAHLHFTVRDQNDVLFDPLNISWQPAQKNKNKGFVIGIVAAAAAMIGLFIYKRKK